MTPTPSTARRSKAPKHVNRDLAGVQSKILHRIREAFPDANDRAIGSVAGVTDTQVSHWRAGRREMGLVQILGLSRHYGAEVVLGPVAATDLCVVVDQELATVPATARRLAEINTLAAQLSERFLQAGEDGIICEDDAAGLGALLRQFQTGANRISVRTGPIVAPVTLRRVS